MPPKEKVKKDVKQKKGGDASTPAAPATSAAKKQSTTAIPVPEDVDGPRRPRDPFVAVVVHSDEHYLKKSPMPGDKNSV